MAKDPPIPFEVGQLVETKSFIKGYRGAWFRGKILKISWKKRPAGNVLYHRVGHVLYHLDFPDETEKWTPSYQVPPNPAGPAKKRKARVGGQNKVVKEEKQLILRPPYPDFYSKDQSNFTDTGSEMRLVMEGGWRVGDLVDWLEAGCYWSGKLTQIMDEEKAVVELLPVPLGEAGIYVANMSNLRPTLDWSQESGWTVPTPEGVADFHQRVKILYPEKQTVGSGIAASEEPIHREGSEIAASEEPIHREVRVESPISMEISPLRDNDYVKQPEGLTKQVVDTAETTETPEEDVKVPMMSDKVDTIEAAVMEAPLMSDTVDTIEAALMDLEELAAKLVWLKQVLNHGYPLPDEASSYEFVERRG